MRTKKLGEKGGRAYKYGDVAQGDGALGSKTEHKDVQRHQDACRRGVVAMIIIRKPPIFRVRLVGGGKEGESSDDSVRRLQNIVTTHLRRRCPRLPPR